MPFYQSTSEGKFICKYILGLGIVGNNDDEHNNIQTNEKEEDYISSSMLGSLLVAQCKTDNALNAVPKGSVKVAKLQTSPSRPKNTGHSKDWYGPKNVITKEDTNSGMPNKGGSNVLEVEYAARPKNVITEEVSSSNVTTEEVTSSGTPNKGGSNVLEVEYAALI